VNGRDVPVSKAALHALVERNVVYGHAIHVTEAEIRLMGRRNVSVTSHPSCNFHMRNGITPVVPLRAAGVNVAMGLDDKTINDDEDAVMELRTMHKVHRLHTFGLVTPALSAYEALEIATLNGGKATGFADEVGALVPGMKGDAILVDLDRVARDPWIDPEFEIADAFVERAMGADVATVVIGGKIVVENHQPRTIDVEGLYREVRAFCAKGLTPEQRARVLARRPGGAGPDADVVHIKSGERHWHGAKSDTTMGHITITLVGSQAAHG
jgi:5-methylthioadenosine/S-adenosylhomocysteine deaminase